MRCDQCGCDSCSICDACYWERSHVADIMKKGLEEIIEKSNDSCARIIAKDLLQKCKEF
jgi:hypothetical protein